MTRFYKTTTKQNIASAYGFRKEETIVKRIREKLIELNDQQLSQLDKWTGNGNLLPDQVEIIVFMMGTPDFPQLLYEEK